MLHRAYSLVSVKEVDLTRRTFAGLATSPVPDRLGDTIDSKGVTFKNPLPLLLYHDSKKPVGEASFGRPGTGGTPFKALISTIDRESGVVRERLDEAVDSLAAVPPLIRGVSIGFRELEPATFNKDTGGLHFSSIEVMELSMVVIPAHQDATIHTLKSLDIGLPESGAPDDRRRSTSAEVTAPTPRPRRDRSMKKTISERVTQFKAERKTIADKMKTLMQPVLDETGDMSPEQQKEYDELSAELKATDADIVRFESLEQAEVTKAVVITDPTDPNRGRRFAYGEGQAKQVTLPPGIEFARYVICKAAGRMFGVSPLDVARERYPDSPRIQNVIKAAVAGATTTDATWAAPLLQDVRTLTNEFLDHLRPKTILGQFGIGNIPSLTRVGFYERVQSQTSGGSAGWVGQAVQKPVTKFDYDSITTSPTKVAALAVLSDELIRFSSPSAEGRVRDALTKVLGERLDRDFIDPDKAAVSNVSPASITNGITGLTPSSGGDADDVRTDVLATLGGFIGSNQDVSQLVWIMSGTSALNLMLMRNSLGNREFPDITVNGGSFEGFPVIVSQYAMLVGSPTPNVVILMNPKEIFLADDGGVTVDMSNEASIEMSDDPANEVGTTVSMYQTNQVALRAERFIYWARGRTSAVAWLDAAAWNAAAA